MDHSQYICFCRKIFPDEGAFKAHLPCVDLVNAINKKASFDIITRPSDVRMIQRSLKPRSDAVYKIMKLSEVVEEKKIREKPAPPVSSHFGKRLPSRTKVPFLSRAVPLSTDHSFERCTCGAVFVTRVGKRQHQARFCRLAKNKSKNKPINNDIDCVDQNIQTISAAELGNEFIESDDSVMNDIYDEQSIIQYDVNENCMV